MAPDKAQCILYVTVGLCNGATNKPTVRILYSCTLSQNRVGRPTYYRAPRQCHDVAQ